MKYLHKYDTKAAHDAVYNGSDYQEPWVAYIDATDEVTYNKVFTITIHDSGMNGGTCISGYTYVTVRNGSYQQSDTICGENCKDDISKTMQITVNKPSPIVITLDRTDWELIAAPSINGISPNRYPNCSMTNPNLYTWVITIQSLTENIDLNILGSSFGGDIL